MRFLRRLLIGRPLHNQEMVREKLPKWKALAIFSSDALSSVAYGPEQIMATLALSGAGAYGYIGPVAIFILLLLAIISISYVQVARANPGGGGSYSVAIHNLGELPALTAGAALFADYTLTVAVSVSAGTEAIVSAFPALVPHEVTIDLVVIFGLLMLINLRGVRESSNVFVTPTYAFIFGVLALVGAGLYQTITGQEPVIPAASLTRQWDWTMLFLILRSFANGCSSMTGVEAISNGVPMFRKPEVHNAAVTTYWMSGILGVMFAGISFLIIHFHIMPVPDVTALSQLAETVFGRSGMYYYIQITTMLVLYLAANTSYNGLPPLLSIMARDGYMPRYLGTRGERLSFSNGIILLSFMAALLVYIFHGNTDHLISLYAIGVFLSFTIAQVGMVVHWRRLRDPGWGTRAIMNSIGAVMTGIVVLVIAVSKFIYGAWVVLIFIPMMIYIFKKIHSHYEDVREQLHLPVEEFAGQLSTTRKNLVVVPVATPTRVVAETLKYASAIGGEIIAVHIGTDKEMINKVRQKWESLQSGIPLATIYSPYRIMIAPLIQYIVKLEKERPEDYVTVLIPEFEPRKWWHRLLHNQTGWILRTLLILKENVVVATIPFHLKK